MSYFQKYSNYDEQSSYQSIVFSNDKPLLETSLNELQQLQDNARFDIIRKTIYSGITELVNKDFNGDAIVYNPTSNGLRMTNKIAIAPFTAYINGYKVNAKGNFTYNKIDNYILVDFGEPSSTSTQDSLVYLEVWFEYYKGTQPTYKYGYQQGDILNAFAMDTRINEETSRRITLCWDIRVKNECDFDSYPEGLGYKDITHYSHIFAQANGQFGTKNNVNMAFCEATNDIFKGEPFYGDKNLYVAGRRDYTVSSSTLVGHYVFAIPLFRVRRRNTSPYSFTNFNGSNSYKTMYINQDSSVAGDIQSRPDKMPYDIIDKSDIIDLRKTVNFVDFNEQSIGDNTINALFNNKLSTKDTEKTRRVQFGNHHMEYKDIPYCTLILPFQLSTLPYKPLYDEANPITFENTSVRYEDSVSGYGVVVEGNHYLSYSIRMNEDEPLINKECGTIEFYFKPFWNGSDEDINQVILTLRNSSNHPILRLEKNGHNLILSHYNGEDSSSASYIENHAVMDMSKDIITANQIYHVRISWTETPMPANGKIYLYINGTLKAQANCILSSLVATTLRIGDEQNTSVKGFLIEELYAYSKNFEILALANSTYAYAKNNFWPRIPYDFIHSDTLLMPSFNSIVNNYSDNAYIQRDTVFHLHYDTTLTQKHFYIKLSSDKIVRAITQTYDINGAIVIGTWSGIGTSTASFVPNDNTIEQIIVHASIELSHGCGGQDVPTDICSAAIIEYSDEANNYEYDLNIVQEVSFNDINNIYPRPVTLLRPRKVHGNSDSAYDIANKHRNEKQCYARLIYYNVSGNGTNSYTIPIDLYGYRVVGVVGCSINRIKQVTKTPGALPGEDDVEFTVTLYQPVLVGETITFELATAGYSFDYDLNSKTIVTNMHRCKLLEFTADGINSSYTLPCLSISDEGTIRGGILKSVFTFIDNKLDDEGNIIDGEHEEFIQCYTDGTVFYDEYGNKTNKRLFTTTNVTIDANSFGTPFITINFTEDTKPAKDVLVQIPIMVSYQMPEELMLSVWYKYIPYQGVMNTTQQQLKRITNWKYFITTLGTGKTSDENIKVNIINNLPGGFTYGYAIDNKDVILKNIFTDMSETLSHEDLNKRLVFMDSFMLKNDSDFLSLVTDYKINKNCATSQDGTIKFADVDFNYYFNDCETAINKYIGAYCTVITESGEIMVLVVGNLNTTATVMNSLSPQYGDLFRIEGRPTTKK